MAALLFRWLRDRRGDMVWNAIVVITVMLPLASLSIDIPRYFILRSQLQKAANATAEAMARSVDVEHFRNTGEVRLDVYEAFEEGWHTWNTNTSILTSKGFTVSIDGYDIDDSEQTFTLHTSGTTRLFFGMSPEFTVHATAVSRFRMDQR